MASASSPSANESAKDLNLVHTVQLKPMIKLKSQEEWYLVGISDVVITSLHSEKTRLKKYMMIMIIIVINKSQETTVISGCQKLTSTIKLRPESDGRLQI